MTGLATPMHEQHGPIAIVPPDVGDQMNALESIEPHDPWIHDGELRDSGDVHTAGDDPSITRPHLEVSALDERGPDGAASRGRPLPLELRLPAALLGMEFFAEVPDAD